MRLTASGFLAVGGLDELLRRQPALFRCRRPANCRREPPAEPLPQNRLQDAPPIRDCPQLRLTVQPSPFEAGDLSDFQIGLLGSSSFLVVYTIFALPLGLLADRVSRKVIVSAGVAIWSIATIFTGLANNF